VVDLSVIEGAGTGGPRLRLTTSFLGLYGSTSPLPSFYSEDILRADEEDDRVRAFLDIFHHRLLSLFYRCWSKHRHHVQFEYGEGDRFTPRLFALGGLGTPEAARATGLPDPRRLVHFAGLLNQRTRSASALEGLLCDYFGGLPVEIEQCTGRWIPIASSQRASLGRQACRLGRDCTLGRRVFDRMGSFRVHVGPLDQARYLRLLPDQEDHRTLRQLVGVFTNDALDFDVALRVRKRPPMKLTSKRRPGVAPRLGWTTWLRSTGATEDPGDTVVFGGTPSPGSPEAGEGGRHARG
jgi:type VI secretion system protein ImpH